MIEEDLERLREQVERTNKSLAAVGVAFNAAFGDEVSMELSMTKARLERAERLVEIYKKDYADLIQEIRDTLKLLKPSHNGSLKKGELLGRVQRVIAARKTAAAAKKQRPRPTPLPPRFV